MGDNRPEVTGMEIFIRLGSPDHIDGEAFVSAAWQGLDHVERLDLLQDWIGLLSEMFDAERKTKRYTPNQACLDAIHYERDKQ